MAVTHAAGAIRNGRRTTGGEVAMWLAALAGRLACVAHLARGHAVVWKRPAIEVTVCPGDIVCDDCGQVLWCRAHDPWRVTPPGLIPDHWGATRPRLPARALFERLQRVMQLADECPHGAAGDAARRAACELVEAASTGQRRVRRHQMLKAVGRLERCRAFQPGPHDHPDLARLKRLTDTLRHEL